MTDYLAEFEQQAKQAERQFQAQVAVINSQTDLSKEDKERLRAIARDRYQNAVNHVQQNAQEALQAQREQIQGRRQAQRHERLDHQQMALKDVSAGMVEALKAELMLSSPEQILERYQNPSAPWEKALIGSLAPVVKGEEAKEDATARQLLDTIAADSEDHELTQQAQAVRMAQNYLETRLTPVSLKQPNHISNREPEPHQFSPDELQQAKNDVADHWRQVRETVEIS